MKKLLSLVLTLALACSLAVPAAAAGQTDDRLAAVTARVKTTLDLNTEEYTEFYGNLDDDLLSPTWYLEWSGDGISLSVSATEEGKVLSYYRYTNTSASASGQTLPAFPAGDRESAKKAALAFLNKVLADGETAALDDTRGASVSLGTTRYRFYGEILINGLSAGLSFSIAVSCEGYDVLSFYRDDLGSVIMGDVPAPNARITAGQAAAALRETLTMRLEYVLAEDEDAHAVLRYLPESGDEFYVDAATGKLIDLSELYRLAAEGEFGDKGNTGGASFNTSGTAADDAAVSEEASLSRVEQEGVDKLEGVLDRDSLDAKVRALSALGLDKYSLATVSYSVGQEADEDGVTPVTAALRYGRQVGSASWRRTATVDARTGELISLSSSGWLPEDGPERTVDAVAAQKTAEDFLRVMAADQFGKTALYDSSDAMESERSVSHSFTYAQQENGYFYTGNSFYVGVDATDGSISSYQKSFDDTVTFDSPDGILSDDEAIDAWLGTYETELQYILVPAAIDFSKPEYEPLADLGLSYLYRLALGYQLERDDYLSGIDAKTGEPVIPSWANVDNSLSYNDLAGHWAREKIETLAQYGVGYVGDSFLPDNTLTQLDLIALLVSTQGYRWQPGEEGAADSLYEYAYSMGLLKRGERDDSALMTRAQTVKLILDASGYGPIAQLEGIFRTSFSDDASIPAEYYGYAALAQGLGMVGGAPGSRFLPNTGATRAEAAVMLYNLMSR